MTRAEFYEEAVLMVVALNEAARAAGTEPVFEIIQSPAMPPDPAHLPAMVRLRDVMDAYRAEHPDAVQGPQKQPTYDLGFASYFLSVLDPQEKLSYIEMAVAANIPPGTIRDWVHGRPDRIRDPKGSLDPRPDVIPDPLNSLRRSKKRR